MIPKSLTTKQLQHEDLRKAAQEAMKNAGRLIQAGYFETARQILTALLLPGPWQLPARAGERVQVWRDLLLLHKQLGIAPPEFGRDDEFRRFAREELVQRRNHGGLGWRPDKVAKQTWSQQQLDEIVAGVQPGQIDRPLAMLRLQAEETLKARIGKRFESTQSAAAAKSELPTDHGQLADAVAEGALRLNPGKAAEFCLELSLLAALLDILDGDTNKAHDRLARLLPMVTGFSDSEFRLFPQYLDFLQQRPLAAALAINEAGAEAYLKQFQSRRPASTLSQGPISLPWAQRLKRYAADCKEAGYDRAWLTEELAFDEIGSAALVKRAKKGSVLNVGVSEADLQALEQRLNMRLPPSYRTFLEASDGMIVPNFVTLLPAADIGWFKDLSSTQLQMWLQSWDGPQSNVVTISRTTPAEAAQDQDPRTADLSQLSDCLQISTYADGSVLLLNPLVRQNDEWEAWHLGDDLAGAIRLPSFRDLMEQVVLVLDEDR